MFPMKKSIVFAAQAQAEELRIIRQLLEKLVDRLDEAEERLKVIEAQKAKYVKRSGNTEVANPKNGPKTSVVNASKCK